MKKFLYLASGAAIALASCSDDLGLKNDQISGEFGDSRLIATMELGKGEETRTNVELVNGGSQYKYTWQQGDAVGVFNVGANDATNAVFVYTGVSGEGGQFNGYLNTLSGKSYYGYYPYVPGQTIENNLLTLTIPSTQNFNWDPKNSNEQTNGFDGLAQGSFPTGIAPAVAYGTSAQDNLVGLSFQPVSAFLVLPVCGNFTGEGLLTEARLEIVNKLADYPNYFGALRLNGDFDVDMRVMSGQSYNDSNWHPGYYGTHSEGRGENEISTTDQAEWCHITLNLGKGVNLSSTTAQNLWFVVPSDLPIGGATINLTLTVDGNPYTVSKTVVNNDKVGNDIIGRNEIRYIWGGYEVPFMISENNDYYVIQSEWQLLEYLYVLENGAKAITEWKAVENYQNYSGMENMWIGAPGASGSKFKNALIVDNLDYTKKSVITNYIPDPESYGEYFKGIYGKYLAGEPLSHIQHNASWSNNKIISGVINEEGATTSITGLTFDAAGVGLLENTPYSPVLANLTLKNVKVNYGSKVSQYNYLCTQLWENQLNNVTLGEGCAVVGAPSDADINLFNEVSALNYNSTVQKYKALPVVINQTGYHYGNTLKADDDFSFVLDVVNVEQFDKIYPSEYNNDVLLYILAENRPQTYTIMSKIQGTYPYSMIGVDNAEDQTPVVSFWNGTYTGWNNTSGLWTAERVSNVVRSGLSADLNIDLDLMGDQESIDALGKQFAQYWISAVGTTSSAKVSADPKNPVKISNVYMNGKSYDGKTSKFYTMFGYIPVLKNLEIYNVVLDATVNKPAGDSWIAILGGQPGQGTENVKVDGYTVYDNYSLQGPKSIGGLYVNMNNGSFNYATGCELTNADFSNVEEGIAYGTVAGSLIYKLKAETTEQTINCPVVEGCWEPYFGTWELTVNPPVGQYGNGGNTINFVGFPADFLSTDVNQWIKPTADMLKPGEAKNYDGFNVTVNVNGEFKYLLQFNANTGLFDIKASN